MRFYSKLAILSLILSFYLISISDLVQIDNNVDDDIDNDEPNPKEGFDINELSPSENNCVSSLTNNSVITCSKIPLYCRSVCDRVKLLNFDDQLKRISSFSFGSYYIKDHFELNFKSSLSRIDSDSFNGLIIDSDAVLKLNIGHETQITPVNDYQYTDDVDDPKQIDYDLEIASTKPDSLINEPKKLVISQNAFRGLNIKKGGRFVLSIKNINRVEFSSNSLNALKQLTNSAFLIEVTNSDLVLFRPDCAKSWKAYTEDYTDTEYSDLNYDYNEIGQKLKIESVLFKISLNSIERVVFEKESFSGMRIFNSSTFQILINKFSEVSLGKGSFSQITEQMNSNFELNLSNGKRLRLSSGLFSHLQQHERSKFVIYFGINESNLCIKSDSFSHLTQSLHSTLRITFLLNKINNLIFNKHSLSSIKQDLNSYIQIYVLRANNFLLDTQSVFNFNQSKLSTFEIWLSKSQSNFTIAASAFSNINQAAEASIKIGFTSSSVSSFYKQASNSFENFKSSKNSEVIYDFSQGTNFNLNFPPRPMPRMMMMNSDKKTVEEMTWKIFPDLGRQSRPDLINLHDYRLEKDDFCKIVDVPFDVQVKLNPDTECSCTVYYLYRIVRLVKQENDSNWLSGVPECYKSKYLGRDLGLIEEMCKFKEMSRMCERDLNFDQAVLTRDKCEDDGFEYFNDQASEKSPIYEIFTTSSSYIEDDSEESEEKVGQNYLIYDDDETDEAKLIEIIADKDKREEKHSFFLKFFENTTILGFFIVVITSVILIGILVFLIVLAKMRLSRKANGFSLYYEDDEGDEDDEDDDDEDDKDGCRKEKQFSYTMFENAKLGDESKQVLVKCDRKESVNSSILNVSIDNENHSAMAVYLVKNKALTELKSIGVDQMCNHGNSLMSIKQNPLSQI